MVHSSHHEDTVQSFAHLCMKVRLVGRDDGRDQVSPNGLNPSPLRAHAKSHRVGRGLSLYIPTNIAATTTESSKPLLNN